MLLNKKIIYKKIGNDKMGTPKEVIENPKEERTKQFLQRYLERK